MNPDPSPVGGTRILTKMGKARAVRRAVESLSRFVQRGGRVDPRRIPDRKPIVADFFLDDRDRIWAQWSRDAGSTVTLFEVFDPAGGRPTRVALPASVAPTPTPVVRDGWFVGVEADEFGIQTVFLGRLPDPLR